ncbi:MAG: zinc ribbon domain-containing protein [Anaerolineae bacterium]|nr:zinc ribbon domain-containing protein [Anaerolineae bacterium]
MNQRTVTCPRCGTANATTAGYCRACGAALNPDLPVPAPIRIPVKREGSRALTAREASTGLALTGAAVVAGLGLRLLSRGIRALASRPISSLTTQARRLLRPGQRAEERAEVQAVDAERPTFWMYGWRRSYTRWPDGSSQVQFEELHRRGRL